MTYHLVIHCAGQLCPAHIMGPAADCFGTAYERHQLIADALARGWYRAIDEHGDRWYCAECSADLPAWCRQSPQGSASRGIEIPADCPF